MILTSHFPTFLLAIQTDGGAFFAMVRIMLFTFLGACGTYICTETTDISRLGAMHAH